MLTHASPFTFFYFILGLMEGGNRMGYDILVGKASEFKAAVGKKKNTCKDTLWIRLFLAQHFFLTQHLFPVVSLRKNPKGSRDASLVGQNGLNIPGDAVQMFMGLAQRVAFFKLSSGLPQMTMHFLMLPLGRKKMHNTQSTWTTTLFVHIFVQYAYKCQFVDCCHVSKFKF